MLGIQNNGPIAGGDDEANRQASRTRVSGALDTIKAARARNAVTPALVEEAFNKLDAGDINPQSMSGFMTRLQGKPWTPSDFHAGNEAVMERKAGADAVIARAIKARLSNPEGARIEANQDRVELALEASPHVEAPRSAPLHPASVRPPQSPRAGQPSGSAFVIPPETDPRFMTDQATAELIALLAIEENSAISDRQKAIELQEENRRKRAAEDSEYQSDLADVMAMLTPEEAAYQAQAYAQFGRQN